MPDIFDEVTEDLRRDRWTALWKKYSVPAIALAAVVVAGAGGFSLWRDWSLGQRQDLTARYDQALVAARDGDLAAASDALAAVADDAGGVRAVPARLRLAAVLAERGDVAGARAVYEGLADAPDVDPLYQGLARLLLVMRGMDDPDMDAAALSAHLAPLLEDGAPWRASALELAALLALRAGDRDAAAGHLRAIIADGQAPAGARRRATSLLALAETPS